MRRRSGMRLGLFVTAVVLIAYLAVCYFLVPELWIFHDDRRKTPLNAMVTSTEQGIPGDPINVGLVGSREQIIRAFAAAGWDAADKVTLRSSIDIGLSVVLDRPDLDAPVSPLFYEGRKQDLAFENRSAAAPTSATMCASGRPRRRPRATGRSGSVRPASTVAWA